MYKFSSILDKMVRIKKNLDVFYLAALQQLMDEGYRITYCECSPEDWAEIDFHPDLELIRANIDKYAVFVKRWEG